MRVRHELPPGNVRRVVSTGKNNRGVITNTAARLVQFKSWAERALLLWLDRGAFQLVRSAYVSLCKIIGIEL